MDANKFEKNKKIQRIEKALKNNLKKRKIFQKQNQKKNNK